MAQRSAHVSVGQGKNPEKGEAMAKSSDPGPMKAGSIILLAVIVGLIGGGVGSMAGSILRFLIALLLDPYGEPFTIIPIPFAFLPIVPACGSVLGLLGGVGLALVSRLPFLSSLKRGGIIALLIALALICGCLASILFTPQAL
jgi:hypothetical protein